MESLKIVDTMRELSHRSSGTKKEVHTWTRSIRSRVTGPEFLVLQNASPRLKVQVKYASLCCWKGLAIGSDPWSFRVPRYSDRPASTKGCGFLGGIR